MGTATAETYDFRADQALAVVVEARIRELWRERSWWRQHRWADWPDIRSEHTNELRALVKLARTARRLIEPGGHRPAELETDRAKWAADRTLAEAVPWEPAEKSYHDLQAR